jgi:hypothetical protein
MGKNMVVSRVKRTKFQSFGDKQPMVFLETVLHAVGLSFVIFSLQLLVFSVALCLSKNRRETHSVATSYRTKTKAKLRKFKTMRKVCIKSHHIDFKDAAYLGAAVSYSSRKNSRRNFSIYPRICVKWSLSIQTES